MDPLSGIISTNHENLGRRTIFDANITPLLSEEEGVAFMLDNLTAPLLGVVGCESFSIDKSHCLFTNVH